MVTPEYKKVKRYIWGLTEDIQGKVTASKLTTIQEAICMAHNLMDQVVRAKVPKDTDSKRKWEDDKEGNPYQQQTKRRKVVIAYAAGSCDQKGYARSLPLCNRCNLHNHNGSCPAQCGNYRKVGHQARDCWTHTSVTCYECGEQGHTRKYYPNLEDHNEAREAYQDPNDVTGANTRPPMLEKGNYIPWESRFRRPMVPDPANPRQEIPEPLSKMTEGDKKKYIADVKVMNYILQAIPNDIYKSVDTCAMLMKCGNESKASRAKKAAKNHDSLALIAHLNASSSHPHAYSSYSPQSYYVTHPPFIVDYDEEYQGELQGDSQEDKLTTAMMLLARAISQKFSSPTNNRLRVSSNTKNQAVVQDGRVDIQTKNAGNGGNVNKNVGRNRNQMFNAVTGSDESNQIVQRVPRTNSTPNKANVQCYNCNEKGHYARDCQKPKVHDAKYFREQILLAMKDEAGIMLMARLQPADGTIDTVPLNDEKAVSQVHDSSTAHEQVSHVKCKTIIQTTDDDQIDSNIIFDDLYVANNGGTSTHDSIARDEIHEIQLLAYTVQREAEKQKRLNNELNKQKDLLQQELETFKDRLAKKVFKERENQYLEDILDLEEKLTSHDRIVYKMGQSLQMIHMLGKKPNQIYNPFFKAGLGYQNPERLKKAIAAQPKMFDGDMIHSDKLKIYSPDSEETLEDAE
ncbi:retrovirus-related pol polyprotein from transposon TNT 1-94 [Tanacetum coccineum]